MPLGNRSVQAVCMPCFAFPMSHSAGKIESVSRQPPQPTPSCSPDLGGLRQREGARRGELACTAALQRNEISRHELTLSLTAIPDEKNSMHTTNRKEDDACIEAEDDSRDDPIPWFLPRDYNSH